MENFSTYSESDLLRMLKQENQAAFSEIYNRYWGRLYAIAYNRVKDLQTAEDITQEVFYSLWKNRNQSEVLALDNYLATAVKYICFAYIKRKSKTLFLDEFEEKSSKEQINTIDIDFTLLFQRYQAEVNKLPVQCRIIFKSRDAGFTNKQIAESMHLSPRTVETQVSKALKLLRKAFKNGIVLLVQNLFY